MCTEYNKKRQREVNEYITTMHVMCVFIFMLALILNNKLYKDFLDLDLHFVFLIGLLVTGIILLYNKNRTLFNNKSLNVFDYMYIYFPLVVASVIIFKFGHGVFYSELILLIPVLLTASIIGKKSGLIMALVCSFVLVTYRFCFYEQYNIIRSIESSLILSCIIFVVGWFVGKMTELENEHKKQLTEIAITDVLTGLYNHRYFQDNFKQILDNYREESLSLIMIDIDYFKHYNDGYGHLAGDDLLSKIGDILKNNIPQNGFAARYGGEEFVVVLPCCNSSNAIIIADKIREKVKKHNFYGEEHQPGGRITISCGVATYPTHASSAKELLNHADQAMYKAKSFKKDKVELYFSVLDNLDVAEDEKDLINSIRTLISVINAKDRYTYGHSERVTYYSTKLAEKINLPNEQVQILNYAAFLHDIGKIEINREILNKKGKPTEEEWNILKQHPKWGSDIVKGVNKLQPVAKLILHHHENYDGSGYPDGMKEEGIPLLARIIRIVDSYDAMTSNRPYKSNMITSEVIEELERCSGKMFDPELTKHFIEIIKEENKIKTGVNNQSQ